MSNEQSSSRTHNKIPERFTKEDFTPDNDRLPLALRAKLAAAKWVAKSWASLTPEERATRVGYRTKRKKGRRKNRSASRSAESE
jgi:hypothetical protein